MGLLKKIKRVFGGQAARVQQLPSGSLTVDRNGTTITSTVSSGYPSALLREIAQDVLRLFREARQARMPLAEITIQFASLRINAREMRGGAIIFLFPQTALLQMPGSHI